jgi:ubiquinone biosynthesis UbiH/UbiF/VisC/COQ6 family hydroxylase
LSKSILERIDVWRELPKKGVSLIKEAKVLDGQSSYAMHFDCSEVCHDTLGYIASNNKIRKALYKKVKSYKNITLLYGDEVEEIDTNKNEGRITIKGKSIYASLIVAADSCFSETRRNIGISTKMHDFARVAILCKMNHESLHYNIAYECFRYGETLAVLPLLGKTSSIIITVPSDKASQILKQDSTLFNEEVTAKFSERFGKMQLLSDRFSYPLVTTYADRFIAERFALIGDAAVGMHPVTAHGFNLGLEGQDALAKQIEKALLAGKDIAANYVLAKYNSHHISICNSDIYHTNQKISPR